MKIRVSTIRSVPATPSTGSKTVFPPTVGEGSIKPTKISDTVLPYRMLPAVATQDIVMIYQKQPAHSMYISTNLHHRSFSGMNWAPDRRSVMLAP
ncbi:unnamed protein product [Rhizoctonia solani]|uniref:Uncharacterized protein n=1 Tax=Rhizoctonia solani TaxID=456999 RepID=A0A8H3HUP5_9AGAM|nr:unnamed protein product [Rhizoctonia solani]